MLTLERELRENIRLHKFAILTKKISQYYMDYYRANNAVFLFPDTLEDCARKKAKYDVRNLSLIHI